MSDGPISLARVSERPRLPDWPRAMKAELAAQYVGLSLTSFLQIVAPDLPPIHLSQRRRAFLREHLDAWLDQKIGLEQSSPRAKRGWGEAKWR